jgi:FkbM family methyltransferase
MFIKRLLFRILSLEAYLKLISSMFFFSYFSGLLKRKEKFALHYFAAELIRQDDHVIDIGANLGYYAVTFGKKVGKKGKVYAVEPVTLFRRVLERNIRKRKLQEQVSILPYALGKEDHKKIKLGVPTGSKHFRHGLTRVVDQESAVKNDYEFDETMMRPDTLFAELKRLDYIKCDVEGYEIHIVPELLNLLSKFHPLIQMETEGENLKQIINMLSPLGYKAHYFKEGKIRVYTGSETFHVGDVLFIPEERKGQIKAYLA